jgi:hypothetical protein
MLESLKDYNLIFFNLFYFSSKDYVAADKNNHT